MENQLLESTAHFGFPGLLVALFCWYFFNKHLPAQAALMEQRFKDLKEAYGKWIEAQLLANQHQQKLFEDSLRYLTNTLSKQIVGEFGHLRDDVGKIVQRLDMHERHRFPQEISKERTASESCSTILLSSTQ